jgi:hypothetical protein
MAYIIDSLKKINVKSWKKENKRVRIDEGDKILIFIIILSSIVITVDCALIVKLMDILKNI